MVRRLGWTPGGESGEGGRGGLKRVCQRVGREVEEEADAKARRALEAREVAVEARERAVEARSALVAMRERAVGAAAVEAVGDEVRRALGAVEARERAVEARERAVAVEAVEAEVRRTLAAVEAKEREAEAAGRVVDMAVGRAIEAVEGKVRRALVDSAWARRAEGLAGGVRVAGNQSEERGASEQVDDANDSSGGHYEAQAVPAEENVEVFGIDPDSDAEVDVELDAGVAEAEGAGAQLGAMSGRDWLRTDPGGRYASVVDVIAALHPPFDRNKGGKTLWNCEHSPAHEYWTSKLRRLSVELHALPRGKIRGGVPVVHRHMASCGDLETCLAIVNHRTPRPIGTVDADARHSIARVLRERMVSQIG